tara:strand:+ start:411 stop:743 length:333 start_codon:yes stop_codon:yes gene_type:complete
MIDIPLPFFQIAEEPNIITFYVVDYIHPEVRGEDGLHMDIGYARNIGFIDLQYAIKTAKAHDTSACESESVGVFIGAVHDYISYREVGPKSQRSLVWADGDIEKLKELIE